MYKYDATFPRELLVEYRGIEYIIDRTINLEYTAVVRFPDGDDVAEYSKLDRAVAGAENLIDNFLDG